MLSSLANYLLRSSTSGAQDSREDSNVEVFPIAARLRQVEIEGNDWILIDRSGNCTNYITRLINLISSRSIYYYTLRWAEKPFFDNIKIELVSKFVVGFHYFR